MIEQYPNYAIIKDLPSVRVAAQDIIMLGVLRTIVEESIDDDLWNALWQITRAQIE